jgi:regulatory protein
MESKSNYRQVLSRLSILCSKSEKCKADIIPILESADLNGEEIENALDYLVKERFIDEERYANNFVHDKFYLNKWGKYKIAYLLRLKKIPEEIISLSLSQISEEDYSKTLRSLLSTKVKFVRGASKLEQKSKLIIFAQGRGFERDLASRLADKIFHSPEDDS